MRIIKLMLDNQMVEVEMEPGDFPDGFIYDRWDHFNQCPIYVPATIPTLQDRFDHRGNHRRKVLFESELSIAILKNYRLVKPLFHKLGKAFNQYLEQEISNNPHKVAIAGKFFEQFFFTDKPCFGRLGEKSKSPGFEECYKIGKIILCEGKAIEQMLLAHLATLRIYNTYLEKKSETEKSNYHAQQKTLRPSTLFENRGRVEVNKEKNPTKSPGFVVQDTPPPYELPPHTKALNKFDRDYINVSAFAYDAFQREIPFVAGPSGSTAECILAVNTLGGEITPEELQQYVFCCAGYLMAAGAHSFHEIMSVAKNVGAPYKIGRYEASIPPLFKNTDAYRQLLDKYPDIITPENISSPKDKKRSQPSFNRSADNDENIAPHKKRA